MEVFVHVRDLDLRAPLKTVVSSENYEARYLLEFQSLSSLPLDTLLKSVLFQSTDFIRWLPLQIFKSLRAEKMGEKGIHGRKLDGLKSEWHVSSRG